MSQAIEGRDYARSVRLHKQSFEALLRYRIQAENICENLTPSVTQALAELRKSTCPTNLKGLTRMVEFRNICAKLLQHSDGTHAKMMNEYLQDVSAMLCLIQAAREKNIELHLAAERAHLPKCFAFGHVNYARYLSFQHVNLADIKFNRRDVWNDLKVNGFGGSLSGKPFSTIHGDLITETTVNREVKVKGGPTQGGYSTSEQATDAFIKTSHLIAKLRATLKERLDILISSTHKELTIGARRRHEETIEALVSHLGKYANPFLNGSARHMKSGTEIDRSVVERLLASNEAGEKQYSEFVQSRLKLKGPDRINFFEKISKSRIKTGLEKIKKDPKVVNILKEDRQVFGILVGKSTSPKEAHSYPLTTIPLALATPKGELRHSAKAPLRNFLVDESASLIDKPPPGGLWLIDGMAVVQSLAPKESWGRICS